MPLSITHRTNGNDHAGAGSGGIVRNGSHRFGVLENDDHGVHQDDDKRGHGYKVEYLYPVNAHHGRDAHYQTPQDGGDNAGDGYAEKVQDGCEGFAADDGLEAEPADIAKCDDEGYHIARANFTEGAGRRNDCGYALVSGENAHQYHQQDAYAVADAHGQSSLSEGQTHGNARANHQRRNTAHAA